MERVYSREWGRVWVGQMSTRREGGEGVVRGWIGCAGESGGEFGYGR